MCFCACYVQFMFMSMSIQSTKEGDSNEYAYSNGACEYLNQLTYAGIYRIHYVLSVCI